MGYKHCQANPFIYKAIYRAIWGPTNRRFDLKGRLSNVNRNLAFSAPPWSRPTAILMDCWTVVGFFKKPKNPGMSLQQRITHRILLFSYGIATLNPILGNGYGRYGFLAILHTTRSSPRSSVLCHGRRLLNAIGSKILRSLMGCSQVVSGFDVPTIQLRKKNWILDAQLLDCSIFFRWVVALSTTKSGCCGLDSKLKRKTGWWFQPIWNRCMGPKEPCNQTQPTVGGWMHLIYFHVCHVLKHNQPHHELRWNMPLRGKNTWFSIPTERLHQLLL